MDVALIAAIFSCLSKFVRRCYQPETNWRSQASMMAGLLSLKNEWDAKFE